MRAKEVGAGRGGRCLEQFEGEGVFAGNQETCWLVGDCYKEWVGEHG